MADLAHGQHLLVRHKASRNAMKYLGDDSSEEKEEYQQPEETWPGMDHVDESDEDACHDSGWCEFVLRSCIGNKPSSRCDLRCMCFRKC